MLLSAIPNRSGAQDRSASALTLLDAGIIAYLVLPLLIFSAWFKPPVAAVLSVLMLYALWKLQAGTRWREFGVRRAAIAAIAVVSLAWTAMAGIGHFLYANLDWVLRDAVLRDLTATAWPPEYPFEGDFPLILRAPIAFYLPAAVVGWLAGPAVGDFTLYLWTALGFGLFLCAVTTLFETSRQRRIAVLLMIAFGGLDLIGWSLVKGYIPQASQHLEAWNLLAQYSSNSTLLFWVPNHALPAWLGTVLILRLWRRPELARIAPLMAATIPLWSPLAAIGLFPFYVAGLNWRRDFRALFAIGTGLPFVAMALVVARYVTMDSQGIPGGWGFQDRAFGDYVLQYLSLCIIEFGLVAWALHRLGAYDLVLKIAIAVLLLLPLYKFGGANDLVMRSSIPALTVLALACVRPLDDRTRSGWRYALMAVLLVGAAGAVHEPIRAFARPAWQMTGRTLAQSQEMGSDDAFPSLPPHYVARLNQAGLAAMMREPTPVKPYAVVRSKPASDPASARP
jgi:hypothetical protein